MLAKKSIIPVFAGIVSLSFLTLAFNAAYNSHYHRYDNGKVLHHAHPFKDTGSTSPFQKHPHNTCELYFLEFLSIPIVLATITLVIRPPHRTAGVIPVVHIDPHHLRDLCNRIMGRAPPVAA